MVWEKRGNRQYLYRSFRDKDGRVRRQYLGRGGAADAAAAKVQQQRAADRQAKDALLRLRQMQAGLDAQASELDNAVRRLMAVELLAAGFHLHAGSEWRQIRDKR